MYKTNKNNLKNTIKITFNGIKTVNITVVLRGL